MDETAAVVDLRSSAFAMRLANLMVGTRSAQGRSVRQMARASSGGFSKGQLKALEAGTTPLDEDLVERVTELYGCDLGTILPNRLAVTVTTGIISAGGVSTAFTPNDSTSLLEAYLKLVRSLRRQRKAPAVDLRRDDIEVLAGFLHEPGETIVERLAALMGASRSQRTAMAGLFASGAVVIGLVGTAMAAGGGVTNHSSLVRGPLHDLAGVSLAGERPAADTDGSDGANGGGSTWVGHSSGFATLGGDIDVDPHGQGVSDELDPAAGLTSPEMIDQTPADTPPPADQQPSTPTPPPPAPQADPGTPPPPPADVTPPPADPTPPPPPADVPPPPPADVPPPPADVPPPPADVPPPPPADVPPPPPADVPPPPADVPPPPPPTQGGGDHGNGGESDGHQSDGHQSDGHQSDGHQSDGHQSDGHQSDGHESDGHESDGHESDGHESDGHESDGGGDHQSDGHQSDGGGDHSDGHGGDSGHGGQDGHGD